METTELKADQKFITFESIQDSLGLKDRLMLINYLTQVFEDLKNSVNAKSDKLYITKMVFYDYLKLPIFIANKVFRSFSNSSTQGLCKEEFVDNLLKLYMGSFEETVTLIFKILDYDKDGEINKDDIKIFLSYLPLKGVDEEYSEIYKEKNDDYNKIELEALENQLKGLEEISNIVNKSFLQFGYSINEKQFTQMIIENNSEIFLQILCFLYYKMPFSPENIETLKIVYNNKNKEELQKIYLENNIKYSCSIQIKMPKFNSLLAPVRMFYKKIKGRINSLKGNINKIDYTKNINNNIDYEYYNTNNNFINGNNIHITNKLSIINQVEDKKNNENKIYENYIYKITQSGKLKKYHLVLINKDIYYYKSNANKEFDGMHNLTGCYVRELDEIKYLEGKKLFSFEIDFKNKKRQRIYYTDDKDICKEFVSKIKEAIGYKKLSDYYEKKEVIGKGKFGIVNLGINKKTGMKVAIKTINKEYLKNLKDEEFILNEIGILKHCHHPYIIRLIDHFEDNAYTYIILEYIKGGDLKHYFKKMWYKFSEEQIKKIISQIAKGIKYLHLYGIIHKDLKPSNIMITQQNNNGIIKICDFGLSKILSINEKIIDESGTLYYTAPEILTRKPYNKEVDIWALGVILYFVLSGNLPFWSICEKEIGRKIVEEELKFEDACWKTKSIVIISLIRACLKKSQGNRIDINDFLNHPWFY